MQPPFYSEFRLDRRDRSYARARARDARSAPRSVRASVCIDSHLFPREFATNLLDPSAHPFLFSRCRVARSLRRSTSGKHRESVIGTRVSFPPSCTCCWTDSPSRRPSDRHAGVARRRVRHARTRTYARERCSSRSAGKLLLSRVSSETDNLAPSSGRRRRADLSSQ